MACRWRSITPCSRPTTPIPRRSSSEQDARMKAFTAIFIQRPVLATVVSLMILVLGLRSAGSLPILQYPRTENAVVTVLTTYYGADPDLVAGFITTPLENAIAQANGIDYMTSVSRTSSSTITANLRLN